MNPFIEESHRARDALFLALDRALHYLTAEEIQGIVDAVLLSSAPPLPAPTKPARVP